MSDWVEVGAGCFVRRYASFDLSVGVVTGRDAALVVDSRASLAQGRELVDDVRALTALPIRALVNTHVHFDHTFGNAAFEQVPVVAHESVVAALPGDERRVKDLYAAATDDPLRESVLETPVRAPDTTFASAWGVNLGEAFVEVVHLGRGHTDGDAVLRVPDADVVFAGDLVEQSGPPSYGEDSYPLEWPDTLDMLLGLTTSATAVVPGHGAVVDQAYVRDQRQAVSDVAATIRGLCDAGVPAERAADEAPWPYPVDALGSAIARGYAQLRRSA